MASPRKDSGTGKTDQSRMGDLSERLEELSKRIDAEKTERTGSQKPPQSYGDASGYAKGYRLVSEFVAGVLVGGLVGYAFDYLFGTLPFGFIVFLLLGFGAGILNMARAANRLPPPQERLGSNPPPQAAPDDEEED
jgi:ATP synthase protein I